jgi:zinc-binding in reverse transcriptase
LTSLLNSSIATHLHILVSSTFPLEQLILHFNYTLDGDYLTEWQTLNINLSYFTLNSTISDTIRLRWISLGLFSVHTIYDLLQYGDIVNSDYLPIWNTKLPLKIKIFLWLVRRNRFLTKMNPQKRGWQGST